MYGTIRVVFLGLAYLFGGLVVAFLIYVLVTNTGEFFRNIMNPLVVVYFFPACVCYWISDWAGKRRGGRQMEESREIHIGLSIAGVIVAIVVFVVVWILGGILFGLFDNLRGLGEDKLQALFRELVVSGAGGYAAMAAISSWIEKANTRFVFFGFSAIVLILVGVYVGFVGPIAEKIGIDIWGMLLGAVSLVAAVFGAYIRARNDI
jgi:hypothetical protein